LQLARFLDLAVGEINMTLISHLFRSLFTIKLIAACALLLGATAISIAQPIYRSVGPDGKVTFSDKPPVSANVKVTNAAGASGSGMASSSWPYELRQVSQKYPVTLYTSENCAPCQTARSMLLTRGVPFSEKTVTTAEDSQALLRLSGENSLPFATIGGQQLKGFSDVEWTQFLNAAGYPATFTLPSSYRQPAATPLVVVAAAPATSAPAATARSAAPMPPAKPAAANPSGIRF
jgi:glutaredoxin